QDERRPRWRLLGVEATELGRQRKERLDEVVEGIVVDVHDSHALAGQRVVPLLYYLARPEIRVEDDFPAQALDGSVRTADEPDGPEAQGTHQILDLFPGPDARNIALEPEILLLAGVEVALDARIAQLVAFAGTKI